jgi:hypothetical protein
MDTGSVLALEPPSTILSGNYRHLQHPQALDRLTLFLGDRSQEHNSFSASHVETARLQSGGRGGRLIPDSPMFARLAGREPKYSAEVPIVYHRINVHCLQCKRRVEPTVLVDQSTIVRAYRTPRNPTIPQLMAAPCFR